MFPRSRWLALWSICLLWPCAGWAADAKTLDERFRQVEKMSQLERDRLQRNLTEFKKLTPEQQAHYRDLHDRVEQSTGHLSSLLQEYSAWLTTLTPSQRDELSKETDPAKKLALVRQFKEEQDYRPEPSPNEPHETPLVDMRSFRQRIPFGPVLPPPELAAVMKVIAKDAGQDREKPNKEPLPKYYRELIKASIDKTPGGPRDWPSPDLQRDIEQALNRSDFRNMINRRPEMKREMMIRVILGSISNLLFEDLKPSFPSEQDFEKVFESLDREQQEAINRMPREDRRQRLTTLHFKSRGDDAPLRMQEFRRHIDRLLSELGLPPIQSPPFGGDGGFRPGAGPGGPRRPQEGRPNGPEGERPGDPPRGRNDQERPRGRPND